MKADSKVIRVDGAVVPEAPRHRSGRPQALHDPEQHPASRVARGAAERVETSARRATVRSGRFGVIVSGPAYSVGVGESLPRPHLFSATRADPATAHVRTQCGTWEGKQSNTLASH